MRQRVIVDTPLVAFINRREQLHNWVMAELATINQPLPECWQNALAVEHRGAEMNTNQ